MEIELKLKDYVIIVLVVFLCVASGILIYNYFLKKSIKEGIEKNTYNTYNNVYITSDRQSAIYLRIYYNLLNNDTEKAYKLVDSESERKFASLTEFKNYINTLNISSTVVSMFKQYKSMGNTYYDIVDSNGNNIVFKTHGVMNYTVIFK